MTTKNLQSKAFTLIELLVVIAIIGLLASIVAVQVNKARAKARDTRRLADIKMIQTALEMYYDEYNKYPETTNGVADPCGGWDISNDGNFISLLKENGFLQKDIADPKEASGCGNYKYFKYGAGGYNCDPSRGDFYVLGVVDMEGSGNPHPNSPGWSCNLDSAFGPCVNLDTFNGCRNWQREFEWVTGGFEK